MDRKGETNVEAKNMERTNPRADRETAVLSEMRKLLRIQGRSLPGEWGIEGEVCRMHHIKGSSRKVDP